MSTYLRLLNYPRTLLVLLALLLVAAGICGTRFSFDASSDTLVVEGDPDLATYLRISETFGGDEFLLLTFTPHEGEALDPVNLATLRSLQQEIALLDGVGSVFSILDAPLLKSPPMPLTELARGFRTLESEDVDRPSAREELKESPVFGGLLITADARTTAMRVDISLDRELLVVDEERARLRSQAERSEADLQRLAELEIAREGLREAYVTGRERLIGEIREVRDRYADRGVLHLGGVPMIAADMIAFVKSDLAVFGGSVVVIVMITLYGFFRQLRWVFLPVITSAVTIGFTVGVLGLAQWPATVISSNFVSLLAIITISLTIHLVVRYRELSHLHPDMPGGELVRQTMVSKFAPCLYNALTTIAAFGSLTASQIVPVEDFGWMMCIGIAIGFCTSFTLFPALLLLLGRGTAPSLLSRELGVTRIFSHLSRWRAPLVVLVSLVWAAFAALGVSMVSMDNRFLEYFRENTDINQGMAFVDAQLGGTVPFDVVLQFPPFEDLVEEEDDFFSEEETYPERYWFTRDKLDKLMVVHRYVESRPEVGKVLSLTSLEDLARQFTEGEALSNLEVAAVLDVLPEHLRDELIRPYASPATGEMRINARVVESGRSFDRQALAADIRDFAVTEGAVPPDAVQVTGMMVLFDSMLKQLLNSQLDTLVYVLLATFAMFLILLRSFLYALLGLIPNVIAAASVIALMGYVGIPLDMMTITIAAISIGIGVDDAIHYLHRFDEERSKRDDVHMAVAWSHATIGRAMYFTSVTVIIGFSVLVFSNFVPTIFFGVLTAAAMALALIANLTLLPSLLVLVIGRRDAAAV
ncbi:MAG: MMPL family transporter [Pseudomonadales bacterium]|nr:MMPL family transporter [Pseudomonadales bacterium]NIX09733.1 MMPL family transporter [Pseudomonadales bacterium]